MTNTCNHSGRLSPFSSSWCSTKLHGSSPSFHMYKRLHCRHSKPIELHFHRSAMCMRTKILRLRAQNGLESASMMRFIGASLSLSLRQCTFGCALTQNHTCTIQDRYQAIQTSLACHIMSLTMLWSSRLEEHKGCTMSTHLSARLSRLSVNLRCS